MTSDTSNIMTGWWLSHPYEKYEFVNWDDYSIPNIWENKIHVPNHQPAPYHDVPLGVPVLHIPELMLHWMTVLSLVGGHGWQAGESRINLHLHGKIMVYGIYGGFMVVLWWFYGIYPLVNVEKKQWKITNVHGKSW